MIYSGEPQLGPLGYATLAQSAEQALRKRQVSSSSLEGGFLPNMQWSPWPELLLAAARECGRVVSGEV